jgi:hypothetical protein
MLYKSTALSVNQRWTMYQFGNILLYRSTRHVDLKSKSLYKMIYSSTNFFVVVVDAFTILSSLCSTGQQLFILICSAVQPTQIIQYVEDASECRLCYRSFTKYIYIPIVPQCLASHCNCDPPPPLSSCSSPKGGGTHSPAGEGMVWSQSAYIPRLPQVYGPSSEL